MKVSVYLNLNGEANEAINFYCESLSLEEPEVLRFKDLPKSDAYEIPEEMLNNVVHCNLDIFGTNFVISDNSPDKNYTEGSNIQLIIEFNELKDIVDVYDKLSMYSDDLVPFTSNEYTKGFAMFRDQFGVTWQLTLK